MISGLIKIFNITDNTTLIQPEARNIFGVCEENKESETSLKGKEDMEQFDSMYIAQILEEIKIKWEVSRTYMVNNDST